MPEPADSGSSDGKVWKPTGRDGEEDIKRGSAPRCKLKSGRDEACIALGGGLAGRAGTALLGVGVGPDTSLILRRLTSE